MVVEGSLFFITQLGDDETEFGRVKLKEKEDEEGPHHETEACCVLKIPPSLVVLVEQGSGYLGTTYMA
jgi:hypothetical protein